MKVDFIKTEQNIIEEIGNINTNYIEYLPSVKKYRKFLEEIDLKKQNSAMEFEKNEKRMGKIFDEFSIKIDYTHVSVDGKVIGGRDVLDGHDLITRGEAFGLVLSFVKRYEEKKNDFNQKQKDLTSLLSQKDALEQKIKHLKSQKTIFKLFKFKEINSDIMTLQEELSKVNNKIEEVNKLRVYILEYEPIYSKLKEKEQEIVNVYETRKETLDRRYIESSVRLMEDGKEYDVYNYSVNGLKKEEENARNFELIKLYKENEQYFADTRKTLKVIMAENAGESFVKNFNSLSVALDRAEAISKTEGADFYSLDEVSQYEYFVTAQKVIEKESEFYKESK